MTDRPSDRDIWESMIATIRSVVLPEIRDEWARLVAIQLVGLAAYARDRQPDPSADRARQLTVVLDAHGDDPVVRQHWPHPSGDPHRGASAILVAMINRSQSTLAEGSSAARRAIRARLIADLDDDLRDAAPLMPAFRGRFPDA